MLTIRQEQMAAFRSVMRQRFEDDLVRHLLDGSSGFEGDPLDAREFVRAGMTKAARYGFKTTGAVQRFIEYLAMLAPDFDTDPRFAWAASILNKQDVSPAARLAELDNYILFVWRGEES